MPGGIKDRDADVWEPLIVVADLAGGGWHQTTRVAAVALVALLKESTPSLVVQLLCASKRFSGGRSKGDGEEAILKALHDEAMLFARGWPPGPTSGRRCRVASKKSDADVWEPLIVVADLAGGGWHQTTRVAAVALVALLKESTPSLVVQLLCASKRF